MSSGSFGILNASEISAIAKRNKHFDIVLALMGFLLTFGRFRGFEIVHWVVELFTDCIVNKLYLAVVESSSMRHWRHQIFIFE